ncbi:MAG: anhydro-N-acetylmuramic acid kinase [Chromatiales bacterium]
MPLFLGLISGTSIDAIDAALVDLDAVPTPRLVAYRETPYPVPLSAALHDARRRGDDLPLAEFARLDTEVGRAFASAALQLLSHSGTAPGRVAAIGSHGQTLLHRPAADTPFTVQIGDPNVIAAMTGITTVADFRRADLALGGQGAPLAPAFHAHLFTHPSHHRAVVNIGGIANITLLPAGSSGAVTGFDTGPGNALLDEWAELHLGQRYDASGGWAGSGKPNATLLARLCADPYFSQPPPKSTGQEHFNLRWLNERVVDLEPRPAPVDVQATLVELTAQTIAQAIVAAAEQTREVLVCGGGVYNEQLMRALRAALQNRTVVTTDAGGIAPNAVEAMMVAWLAKQRLEGRTGTLPAVTGARRRAVLGAIYAPPP